MEKSPEAFRTIREVADAMDLPQHVLRFWETRFPQIRPLKRAGGRRYYRPEDVDRLQAIKRLLYEEGYTIKGVQKLFRQQGVQATTSAAVAPRLAASVAAAEAFPESPSQRDPAFDATADEDEALSAVAPRESLGEGRVLTLTELKGLHDVLANLRQAERLLLQARAPSRSAEE